MKSALRATVILSTSSIVSILVGMLSSKILAILIGPSGIGYLGLLQGLVGLAGLLAGMGIGAGLVSIGASALARKDFTHLVALRRAAWLLFWSAGGLTLLLFGVFRIPISQVMLGDPEKAGDVLLMGLALLFSLAAGIQTSLLNAYHRVTALARIGLVNSILTAGVSITVIYIWHEQGIGLSVIIGAVSNWAISSYFLRRDTRLVTAPPTGKDVAIAVWSLLRFGVPYAASQVVGSGVQFLLPTFVLHTISIESVGYYRAASSVAGVYLGFLLSAMSQDYYPRVSAINNQPAELIQLVNQQHRLIMLIAVPVILIALALAPYLIPLVYSAKFTPAVEVLEWQLIGDIFKFSSWTMGFIILARRHSVALFLVELLAGVDILAASWLGVRWFGLAGLGIAYLFTYIVHYLVTWFVVHRDIRLTWTVDNKIMFLAALLAVLVIVLLPTVGLEHLKTPIALMFALIAGGISLIVVWREIARDRISSVHNATVNLDKPDLNPLNVSLR